MNVFFLPGPVHLVAKTQDLIVHFQDQLAVLIVSKSTSTWPTSSGPALRPALRQDPGPGLLLQNQLSGPLFTKTLAPGLLLQNLPSGLLLAKTLDLVHFQSTSRQSMLTC